MEKLEGSEPAVHPGALAIILALIGASRGAVTPQQISHELAREQEEPGLDLMIRVAQRLGFRARLHNPIRLRLPYLTYPVVVEMKDGALVTAFGATREVIHLANPSFGKTEPVPLAEFYEKWSGRALLLTYRDRKGEAERSFSWRWFLTAISRYRKPIAAVVVFSFLLQLAAFVTPIFFQVVVDKVIVHRAPSTLDVLAIGLFFIYFYEALLGWLRGYVFPHTTNRIDVEIASRLFRHMISLPMSYFDRRRVGDTMARMREVENIRDFLTGSALTLIVDSFFAVALMSVLFFYSPFLAWIVAGSIPVYVVVSLLATPRYRELLEEQFSRGAQRQSFLVETVSGIGTLKSMAVEPSMQRQWDHQLAGHIGVSFKATALGNAIGQFANFVSHMVQLLTLYFGAREVMAGSMTVGELVAFNMLAGQVAQPILKLVNLWQTFQKAKISIDRIADILNAEPERKVSDTALIAPPLKGAVRFDNVSFRYEPNLPDALREASLDIRAGEFIGIAGSSGSGKSTLAKLLQNLYRPTEGRILIDEIDVTLLEPSSFRAQIGVVLQENVLFNATVAENIALGHPETRPEQIVHAAKLAGAHDFIVGLPRGYDTMIGERGATLSGGQRQRIAIARALVTNPPILIFDEATSALDYESERAIQDNMARICDGRTVIVIAHRLSTLRNADRIVVIEKGRIVEVGTPDELLQSGGRFAQLNESQGAAR